MIIPMNRRNFLSTVAAGVTAASHLHSAAPGVRRGENFNAGWLFRRQQNGGGALGSWDRDTVTGSAIEPAFRTAHLAAYDDAGWEQVWLPHTWNAIDGCDDIAGYFRGIGWYRKHFPLAESDRGRRVFLEFEGANQVCEAWVNGHRLGDHKGGYTGFEFDITSAARFGAEGNVLTVKVDNIYSPNIAPTVKTDVTFYGGIYRDVWLRVSEPVYLTDVYWRTPEVSAASAQLSIHSTVVNTTARAAHLEILHEVLDSTGAVVAQAKGTVDATATGRRDSSQSVRVTSPRLWSPDFPNLYRIRSTIREAARPIDSTEIPLGFRWFRFDANQGFFLNGKRLQINGTTWHQVYPGMGNALPNSRHVKDMENIREMGCNLFRTSHYPHDPAVMEACDRLGMLVLDELFVGEEVENTKAYFEIQAENAREMIHRDRNYPSVILWGMGGEVDAPQKSVEVVTALLERYRQLDPTRIVTMHAPRVEGVKKVLDVVGLYSTFKEDDQDHKEFPDRKYLIEEYTASDIGRGIYGGGPHSEDLGCTEHEEFVRQVNLRPWIAGCILWHQFDYDGEEYDPVIPHLVSLGVADPWRIPKDVYFFYQSQWNLRPMLHICGHWTWPGEEGKTREVKVYSNLDEVELSLNGRSLGTQKKPKVDGLEHPPFVWRVPYEPGTLQAAGRGLTCIRKTAGAPAAVLLKSDTDRVTAGDRESLAYLTASIVDKDGIVVPSAAHAITFTSYGPGELLPQTWPGHPTGLTWNAIAGMTRVAFRATDRIGRSVVSAYVPGLALGRTNVQVARPGRRDEMEYRSGADIYK